MHSKFHIELSFKNWFHLGPNDIRTRSWWFLIWLAVWMVVSHSTSEKGLKLYANQITTCRQFLLLDRFKIKKPTLDSLTYRHTGWGQQMKLALLWNMCQSPFLLPLWDPKHQKVHYFQVFLVPHFKRFKKKSKEIEMVRISDVRITYGY